MTRSSTTTIDMTVEFLGREDHILRVTGTYYPAQGAYTYPGEYAPTDPPEPARFEPSKIVLALGVIELEIPDFRLFTEGQQDQIVDYCIQDAEYGNVGGRAA